MKSMIVSLLLGFWVVALGGCNTVSGVGKDIQKAGQTIEKSSR